jgi:pimeloyl-ACP methyl ester carboxylesterase
VRLAIKALLILLMVMIVTVALKEITSGRTDPIKDSSGDLIPESIAILEKVELGGMEQWILARGANRANPVLLWLHGGPGAAQMPIARHFSGDLESDFIVVHWDQRGAGKSNPVDFNEETMTVENFIADTHELTRYLKDRFGKEKIYLVGHSWGSQLGIQVAHYYPEDYYAYIGVSQYVDPVRSQELAYDWLKEQVTQSGNQKDLALLEDLGPPRYSRHNDYVTFAGLVDRYGGSMDMGMGRLAWIALQSPEYRLLDYYAWLQGSIRGSGPMWEESQRQNIFDEAAHFSIPIYFFSGANDRNTPLKLVEDYYLSLDAPAGKELLVFENSAHTPFMAEPDKFNRELIRIKEETYSQQ